MSARFGRCISWANEKKGVSFILNSSFIPLVILIIALKLLLLLSLSSTIAWAGGGEGGSDCFGVYWEEGCWLSLEDVCPGRMKEGEFDFVILFLSLF